MSLWEPALRLPRGWRAGDQNDDADGASLEATETQNGEMAMGELLEVVPSLAEAEHSGVFVAPESIGMVEVPTVEQIDALPTVGERLMNDAMQALDLLSEPSLMAVISQSVCRLCIENKSVLAEQLLQLISNLVEIHKARADSEREEQRAAESALINALGHFREYTFKAAG